MVRILFRCLSLISPITSWNGNMDCCLVLFWLENFVFRFRITSDWSTVFFVQLRMRKNFLNFSWEINFVKFLSVHYFICNLGGLSIYKFHVYWYSLYKIFTGIPLIQSFNLTFPLRLNWKPSPDFSVCRILSGLLKPKSLDNAILEFWLA